MMTGVKLVASIQKIVNVMNFREEYKKYCYEKGIEFQEETSVLSYDDTTMFCPAGMQQFKKQFRDKSHKGTLANIQPCLRLNDLDEIGDGSHLLYFNMMGLFSFREMTMKEAVDFWVGFVQDRLGVSIDHMTYHPDKPEFIEYTIPFFIKPDTDCIWKAGDLEGYCIEFYHKGIEIGNIVNTGGDCIDVGFGLERLEQVNRTEAETLKETINEIWRAGVQVSNNNEGYVLKKLIRRLIRRGGDMEDTRFKVEKIKFDKMIENYERLSKKETNKDRSPEWWWDTHGIDVKAID
jgi:alanyl-tRNA synthetase